jgi:hypothetical protein
MPKTCFYCGNTASPYNYTNTPYNEIQKNICNACYNIRCYRCLEKKDILTQVQIDKMPCNYIVAKDENDKKIQELQEEHNKKIKSDHALKKVVLLPEYSKICTKCLYSNLMGNHLIGNNFSSITHKNSSFLIPLTYHNIHIQQCTTNTVERLTVMIKLFEHIYDDHYTFKETTIKQIETLKNQLKSYEYLESFKSDILNQQQMFKETMESMIEKNNDQYKITQLLLNTVTSHINSPKFALKSVERPEHCTSSTELLSIDDKIKYKLNILLKEDSFTDVINEKYDKYCELIKKKISNLKGAKQLCQESGSNIYLSDSICNINKTIKEYELMLSYDS